jgi:cysteine desulfurase/selenocysteine lyase
MDLEKDGLPRYGDIGGIVSDRTRVITVAHVSNVAGVLAPVEEWAAVARKIGACSLVDASQSISHMPVDVKRIGCDFLVFSGHKTLGPSGIGVLYGRREKFAELGLYQTGGGMVQLHSEQLAIPREVPWRFEAGTPPIEGILGLAAAIGYLRRIGMENVQRHSNELGIRLVESLQSIPGARIVAGSAPLENRIGLAAFTVPVPGLEAEAIGRLLSDRFQIMVSAGYHCAHILHHRLGLQGTVRASAQVFNTIEEIDRLIAALRELCE